MSHSIIVGCDQHKRTLRICAALDKDEPVQWTSPNTPAGRRAMLERLRAMGEDAAVHFVYEASYMGFGLCDELRAEGVECHVLACSKIARSPHTRQNKTDAKDARRLFELLRAHVLAGNDLPAVWVPDAITRDDREITRARVDAVHKMAAVKTQVHALLARCAVERPEGMTAAPWTLAHRHWLGELARGTDPSLGPGARIALASLLRQIHDLEDTIAELDEHVKALADTERYRARVERMVPVVGVSVRGAMDFLTELGDLSRFANRRALGSYLGLAPASYESGEANDRKGRITGQGPSRVRRMLCQAAWKWVVYDPAGKAFYQRIVSRNPSHKKKALVAAMRKLAILLWHLALGHTKPEQWQAAPAM